MTITLPAPVPARPPVAQTSKWQVFKISDERWRFTNLHGIAGDAETWAQAFDEAHHLATVLEPTA